MKVTTARKILEHYLGKDNVRLTSRELTATYGNEVFSSYIESWNPTELTSLHVRNVNDHSDPHSDYFAGHFCKTMPDVIRHFLNRSLYIKREADTGRIDYEGKPGIDRLVIRFNVRMEGMGTKMKPVVHVEGEYRLVDAKGYWSLAGAAKTITADLGLVGLIDGRLESGEDYRDGIILDYLAETMPEVYGLYERLMMRSEALAA